MKQDQWLMLSKMISIVSNAFEGRVDKGGKPYILHCLRVMNNVEQEPEVMQIAVGHDLVEDRPDIWSIQKLREQGFSERVLKAIELLTHSDHSIAYMDYIKVLALNKDAKQVKKADLRDNSDITRLKGLRKKDFDRLEKYNIAYAYLCD